MTNYKQMLIERSRKARESEPMQPEKPLNHIQHQNHVNLRKWREKLFLYNMARSWMK